MSQVKCTNIENRFDCLTVGKVYDVIRIDHDGDIWIIDDHGEEYFMFPRECEVL